MLEIIIDPNPILHQKAKLVSQIDDEIKTLVQEMRKTMHKAEGIGLAAPQVGISKQVAVIEIPAGKKDRKQSIPFTVLINPKITNVTPLQKQSYEGCLSIPGIEVNVKRPVGVSVAYTDEHGLPQSISADGLFARAIQHEIDHLNGILITDHGKGELIKSDE